MAQNTKNKKHGSKKKKVTPEDIFVATMKATDVAILRQVDPIAKKAKAAFDKSDIATQRGDDLRITGGQLCLEIKVLLKGTKIKLEDYLPEHTGRTHAWCHDAMTIAAKPDPVAALATRKAGKAKSVAKIRAKAKATGTTKSQLSGPKEGASITEVISTALVKAGESGAKNILQSEANRLGLVTVERDKYDAMAKTPATAGLKAVLAGFDKLSARDQMIVAEHAATKVGCTLSKPTFSAPAEPMNEAEQKAVKNAEPHGEPEIPAFLKRDGQKPKVSTKAKKKKTTKKEERAVKRGAVA